MIPACLSGFDMTPDSKKSNHVWSGTLQSLVVGVCVFYLGRELAVWLNARNVHGFWGFLDNLLAAIAAGLLVLVYERRRVRAVEALRNNEEKFRRVVEHIGDALFVDDVEGRVVFANARFFDLFGFSPEELPEIKLEDYVAPEYRASLRERHDKRMHGEAVPTHFEYEGCRRDGTKLWLEVDVVPVMDETGRLVGTQSALRDISERKRAEEAIRDSEERLRLASQLGGMFAYSWDSATDLIERSGESEQILGVKAEEAATGAAISAMVHPDDKKRLEAALANLTVENPTIRITYRIVRPDGKVKWLERNSRAYFDGNGTLTRMVGMILDVTEHKLAEQNLAIMPRKLIEAQEQERSRIGRELHDDINQRLAMLAVELNHLQDNPTEVGSRLQELRNQTAELSNDVQALSHELHSSKLEYLGVVKGIRSWCKEFGERHKMEVDFRTDVSHPIPSDIGLTLFRVLQEALHNASKYSGEKRVEVELTEHSNEVHLIIRDSGKGFDVAAAKQGRGLGLTSIEERVRLVNGTITIDSKPMVGTTIRARIPFASEKLSERAVG